MSCFLHITFIYVEKFCLQKLIDLFGIHDFLPSNVLLEFIAQEVCGHSHSTEKVCGNIVFLIAGFDTSNLNDTRLPVYLSHLPAGTSVKDFLHYLQVSATFRSFPFSSFAFNILQIHEKPWNILSELYWKALSSKKLNIVIR